MPRSIPQRAVLFAALLFASTALAQVRESITVEVVEVPVYVTAADGTPVRGLSKDAFSLFVNGKPQPIEYFDVFDFGANGGGQALTPVPPSKDEGQARVPVLHDTRERRLYLLLFDLAFTQAGLIERAQKAADDAVLRSNSATDYFAVATYTRGGGLRFVIPFLNDYVVVRRAIATLRSNDVRDPLGVGVTPRKRSEWAELEGRSEGKPLSLTFGGSRDQSDDEEAVSKVRGGLANQEIARQIEKDDVTDQFAGLSAAAKRLAALEGQKHVVIFSAGFNPSLFNDLGKGYGEDPRLHGAINDMAHAFRQAGAFLDTIDLVGNRTADASESLRRMAEPTGGQSVRNTNDLSAAVTRLTSEHKLVYLLGFKRRDNGAGDIDVRVANVPRGTQVSFRRGFGKPQQGGDLDTLQLADIVMNDLAQNGLSMKLEPKPVAGGAEITILFRPPEVVAQLNADKPWVEALLYVFDEHGATAVFVSKRLPFDDKKAPAAGVAGLREKATLPPGKYTVKALLHVGGTQAVGFAKEPLVVK